MRPAGRGLDNGTGSAEQGTSRSDHPRHHAARRERRRYLQGTEGTLPEVPVILLTAKDRVSDKVMGLESGAEDYIVKPFETLELMARIKVCLRRYGTSGEKAEFGDLSIDFKKRSVQRQRQRGGADPQRVRPALPLRDQHGGAPKQGISSGRRSGRARRSIPGAGSSTCISST